MAGSARKICFDKRRMARDFIELSARLQREA